MSSVARWNTVAIHPDRGEGRVVFFRTEIDAGGAEVSNMCHIGSIWAMAAAAIFAEYAWFKMVPFGEIETKSSDPKHAGWPMRPSDGLGVLGLTVLGVVGQL